MSMFQPSAVIGAALLFTQAFAPGAQAQTSAAPGFVIAGRADLSIFCGSFPASDSFQDGSYIVFDGRGITRRSADGTIIRDYGILPGTVFPSFMKVDEAAGMAYFGESGGMIRSLDLATGDIQFLANLLFNYDFAFDVVPGLAYVTSSAAGSGMNGLYRLDLLSGLTVLVAELGGFSGPVDVDATGNVFVGVLPGIFPFPQGDTKIVEFDSVEVTSGAVLTDELDGDDFVTGLNGLSSSDLDPITGNLFIIETNTGAGSFGSTVWRVDGAGNRVEEIATADGYSGGVQYVDSGIGTEFSAYQPAYTSVRYAYSQCSAALQSAIYNVTPQRPVAAFEGPGRGGSGNAIIEVTFGTPAGFASLWWSRASDYRWSPVIESLGGAHPVALNAAANKFVRRLPPVPLTANGFASLNYFQDVSIEGAILFQWIVFDASMNLVTSSNAVFNVD